MLVVLEAGWYIIESNAVPLCAYPVLVYADDTLRGTQKLTPCGTSCICSRGKDCEVQIASPFMCITYHVCRMFQVSLSSDALPGYHILAQSAANTVQTATSCCGSTATTLLGSTFRPSRFTACFCAVSSGAEHGLLQPGTSAELGGGAAPVTVRSFRDGTRGEELNDTTSNTACRKSYLCLTHCATSSDSSYTRDSR